MKVSFWVATAVAALLALMGSVYIVNEGQTGMVLQFGRVVRSDIGPGLHFKFPLVETARIFDRRLQVLDAEPERYLTSERKDVSVDFFAVGMIEDPRAFYRATGGDESVAVARLAPIIKDSLRNEINSRTLTQLVSGNRNELIEKQLPAINAGAKNLGMQVVDIRFKQIDLPTDSEVIDPLLQFRNYGLQLPNYWSTVSNGAAFGTSVEPTPEVAMLADENRRSKLHEAVGRFLEVLLPGPAFVEIENAHHMDEASADLLVVAASDGQHIGYGEGTAIYYQGETAEKCLGQVERFSDELGGHPVPIAREILQSILPPGAARNALDCALWDLEAKQAGVVLWALVGMATPPLPLETAFTISLGAPEAMHADARSAAVHPAAGAAPAAAVEPPPPVAPVTAGPAVASPAVGSAAAPAQAAPAARPAPKTADAAPKPAPKPRANAQTQAPAANEPPWQHDGPRGPAPATLSQPSAAPAPAPAGEGLGPLRAALRQCDSQDNMLSKGVCVVRARHQHCGSNWGKVPECPMSNRNNDPYSN